MNGAPPVPHAAVMLERSLLPSIRALRAKRKMRKCGVVQEKGTFSSGQSQKKDAKQWLQPREEFARGEEGTRTHDHRAEI